MRVQIEHSLMSRGIEATLLPAARGLGVGITAYGVLSRGLLSGSWTRERALARSDFRNYLPRFTGENLAQNLAIVESVRELASARGATVAQLAIAWVLAQGADIVPLVGARSRERLTEALGALELTLSNQEIAQLEAIVSPDRVAGTRYDEHQMRILDSERSSGGAG